MTHVLRTFYSAKYIRPTLYFFLVLVCPLQVIAQSTVDMSASDRFRAVVFGGTNTIVFGSNGTPLAGNSIPSSLPTGNGWYQAGNYGVQSAPSGATMGATVSGPVANGVSAQMNVRSGVSSAAAAKAIGRAAKKIVTPIAVGSAIWDLAQELGFNVGSNADGSPALSLSGCVTTRVVSGHSCRVVRVLEVNPGNCKVKYICPTWIESGYSDGFTAIDVWERDASASSTPVTLQDLEDAIAAKSGWPSNSALPRALADALKSGEVVQGTNPIVTGPSTVQGQRTQTNTPAQNGSPAKSTVTNTTHNVTYQSNSYSVSTVTVSTVTVGDTTTTTTETKDPLPSEDPCKERPNSNGCREDEFDTPEQEIPKKDITITFAPENLGFAGGTCPADKYFTPHGQQPIKVFDWVMACDKISTYVRPIVLAMSMFIAMVIIFAGGGRSE